MNSSTYLSIFGITYLYTIILTVGISWRDVMVFVKDNLVMCFAVLFDLMALCVAAWKLRKMRFHEYNRIDFLMTTLEATVIVKCTLVPNLLLWRKN
jgi:hypothetical protein